MSPRSTGSNEASPHCSSIHSSPSNVIATVFERSREASGASIRNFDMVWPIGQPSGLAYSAALLSRERWLRLGHEAGIWVNPCGRSTWLIGTTNWR